MKLGKHAARHDPRTLKLLRYVRAQLPPPKPAVNWSKRVSRWGVMKNNTLGDCTCAAAGHLIRLWTASTKTVRDEDIIEAYRALSGYQPGKPATDRGAVELDVLKYWRKTGIGGHRILAFVAVEPGEIDQIKTSIELFGGCYIGLELPLSAQKQRVWSVPPSGAKGKAKPGSWGGHAVPVVAYDARGLTVVTWGATKRMTWDFWRAYCDEAYALLSTYWIDAHCGVNPEGFALDQLKADLAAVTDAREDQAA